MSVHIGTHGLCNDCESERAWKNSKRVTTQQRHAQARHRVFVKKHEELQKHIAEFEGR